jgi:hypothetical protein
VRLFHNRKLLDPRNFFTPGKDGYRIIAGSPGPGGSQISVPKSKSLNPRKKPMTIEARIRADAPDGAILACGGVNNGYALILKGGKPRIVLRIKDKTHGVTATESVVGKWAHVAGVLTEDKKLLVYIDGKLSASGDAPSLLGGPPGQGMEIGADAGTGVGDYKSPYAFSGEIDDVRIHYRALEPNELGKTAKKSETLALCYSFDRGRARDESGNANHGKVTGARPSGKAMKFGVSGKGWQVDVPIRVKAMVAAGGQLVIAGPPDVLSEKDPLGAFEGRKGGLMWVFGSADGRKIAENKLDSPPVFNGMAAAGGRLYVVTRDGNVRCFGDK